MIHGVLGKPGHGKSLFLLWEIARLLLEGWDVATNMSLTPECPFHDRVIRLDDGRHNVFQMPEKATPGREAVPYVAFWHYMPWRVAYVLDEIDNVFDSMDFMRLATESRDARLYFKQHRKRGDIIVYAVQNLDNVWTRIRRMTETFTVCAWNYRTQKIFRYFPIWMSSFIHVQFSDAMLSPDSYVDEGRFWYREAQTMFTWYDSKQLVGDPALYGWAGPDGRELAV